MQKKTFIFDVPVRNVYYLFTFYRQILYKILLFRFVICGCHVIIVNTIVFLAHFEKKIAFRCPSVDPRVSICIK